MVKSTMHDEVLTHLRSGVLLVNRKGELIYMNPAAERFLSVSLKVARGKSLSEIIGPEERLIQLIRDAMQTGRTIRAHDLEIQLQSAPHLYHVEIAPIGILENPSGALLWISEMTMAQALKEESRLRDRLDMMGTIASGLAHEIRNPLGGIRGAAQMVERELDNAEAKEYTQIILSEVDRLNDLIGELLNFSKPKKKKKGNVNLHKILREILQLYREKMKSQKIELIQEFDPSLPPVYGHGPSLKQAFLNIIKNAIEAMPQGGELRVTTQFLLPSGTSPMAQITIKDSGHGISKEHQKDLFAPFFTTKRDGTGLGLMMVQRILKEHGGSLKLESKPKKGTAFHLFLKLATERPRD